MVKLLMTDPLYNPQIGISDGYSLSSYLHNGSWLSQTFTIHLGNGQSKQLCFIVLITNCSCCISLQKYLLFSIGGMIVQAQVNMQVPYLCFLLPWCKKPFHLEGMRKPSMGWYLSVYKNFHCVVKHKSTNFTLWISLNLLTSFSVNSI